jgi:hypothetical protein
MIVRIANSKTVGLAVRAGIPCYVRPNRSPDLVEDEVKFF